MSILCLQFAPKQTLIVVQEGLEINCRDSNIHVAIDLQRTRSLQVSLAARFFRGFQFFFESIEAGKNGKTPLFRKTAYSQPAPLFGEHVLEISQCSPRSRLGYEMASEV